MFKSWKFWVLGVITCLFVLFVSCQSPSPVVQPSSVPLPNSSVSPPVTSPIASPSPVASAPTPVVSGERLLADLNTLDFERYTAAELQRARTYIATAS